MALTIDWNPIPTPIDWEAYTPQWQAIQADLDLRINTNIAPAVSKELWSVMDHATETYVRNPDRWTVGLDLSGCAVWTSSGDPNKKTCTMITPSCGIMAAHYALGVGTTVKFVTTNGDVISRKVVATKRHPDYVPPREVYADLFIVKLDEPVVDCRVLFILPDDWRTYLPNNGKYLPVATMCQHEHVGIHMIDHIQNTFNFMHNMPTPGMFPNSYRRGQFYENLVGGDSSDPCIMFYDGLPIIMTVWRYGGFGSGASIVGQSAWIDQTCFNLAGEIPRRIQFVKRTCSFGKIGTAAKSLVSGNA